MGLFGFLKRKQQQEDKYYPEDKDLTSSNEAHPVSSDNVTGVYNPVLDGPLKEEEVEFKFKGVLSNRTLTLFLSNGDILVNNDVSKELFEKVRGAKTEQEVRNLLVPHAPIAPTVKEHVKGWLEYDDEVKQNIREFTTTQEFTEKNGLLYLNGVDLPIPALLAQEFMKSGSHIFSDYYDSLKRFWCWCVLNPNSRAREDLFGFLEGGDFKIGKSGFFLAFRNVEAVDKGNNSKALIEFISAKYLNIKTKQKKSPKSYEVWEDGGLFAAVKGGTPMENTSKLIGNLADLYNQLGDMEDNEYTDAYTKKMKIKLGVPVRMPREECDNDPHSSCSRGLHVKSKHYGSGHGKISLVVMVNPMNVVAVPVGEPSKMRVCEYLPLGVVEGEWSSWLEDTETLTLEEGYVEDQLQDLLARASQINGTSVVKQVAKTLKDWEDVKSQRVVKVK